MKYRLFWGIALFALSATIAFAQTSPETNAEFIPPDYVQLAMSSPDYQVTAGDIYTLTYVAGTAPVAYRIAVDTTYQIRISNLAVINAAGQTFKQLKTQVESIVAKNYPMSGVQFVLVAPALFAVQVKGEVKTAGEQTARALQRLSSFVSENNLTSPSPLQNVSNSAKADYLESNLTPYSSLRNVSVTSASGKTATYDLFQATRFGDLTQDPYVRPGDIITVKRIDRVVTISGAVERPGSYQLLRGENLRKLVSYYAAGLAPRADASRTELLRSVNAARDSWNKLFLSQTEIDADYPLEHLDAVTIPSTGDLLPVVFIEGAVSASRNVDSTDASTVFEHADGASLSNKLAVRFAEGENYAVLARRIRDWFSPAADTDNTYISRHGSRIFLNLTPMLYDPTYRSEHLVEANDTLVVPFRQYFVTVAGAVHTPGRYPYVPDRTWEYYVGLAGGLVKERNSRESINIRTTNGERLRKIDSILPETMITANTNGGLYYFNQYAPLFTAVLSVVLSAVSINASLGK
jgi:protein involved in polysaccharide export with SLBB domain